VPSDAAQLFPRSMLLAILTAASHAHVAMRFIAGQPGPIRNAGSASGNGRGSVAGACGGGTLAFGANGIGQVTDGQQVTLNINYAAGHRSNQNAFRFVYACGDTSQNGVENSGTVLTAAANGCTAQVSGAAAPYTGTSGVAAPNAIVDGGYTITCTLPSTTQAQCTMSLLDQRDWGGCVDVNVLPANAALPPAPPPAPIVSNRGSYAFSEATTVDTSASTFTCCPLSAGYLAVPDAGLGAQTFSATMTNGRATGCRTSADVTAPTTATHEINEPLTFTLSPSASGNKYVASSPLGGSWAGQPFELTIENGALDFANTGAAQPIICDGYSRLNSAGGGSQGVVPGSPGTLGGGDGGMPGGVVFLLVVLILCTLGGGVYYCRTRCNGDAPPPPSEFFPPPPPPPTGLPAGWVEMADPSSGRSYFYNCDTGETTWTKPGLQSEAL